MIVAHAEDQNGRQTLVVVLEPANLEKLTLGQPMPIPLQRYMPGRPDNLEILLCYTPDSVWVSEQVQAGRDLVATLDRSLSRKPVYLRRGAEGEDLVKVNP
jgi:hypothetical protein